jgi:hypothetical protein
MKYTKSLANSQKTRVSSGTRLQITQIIGTVAAKGGKPRLWGFHRRKNDVPSLCIVKDANGTALRTVKSPPSRWREKRVK